jgi:hypothetical protein
MNEGLHADFFAPFFPSCTFPACSDALQCGQGISKHTSRAQHKGAHSWQHLKTTPVDSCVLQQYVVIDTTSTYNVATRQQSIQQSRWTRIRAVLSAGMQNIEFKAAFNHCVQAPAQRSETASEHWYSVQMQVSHRNMASSTSIAFS